jgi:Fe2+ or Zn2+ uptake regulation protein
MRNTPELIDLYRQRGLRVTPQRLRIFEFLAGNVAHPTADTVHAAVRQGMPTISLRTVYEILNELAELGEIQALDLGTGSRRFDPNVEPHHHLACLACGKVRDFSADYRHLEPPADQLQGFRVLAAEVIFRGYCDECAHTQAPTHQGEMHA